MGEKRTYSDAVLQAYLNGLADAETAAQLERAVETDPTLEARLMAMDPLAAQVKDAFASIPSSERVATLKADLSASEPETLRARSFPRAPLAACVIFALGLGFAAAWFAKPDSAPGWQEQIAIYQALYTEETIGAIHPTEDGLTAQFAKAEATLGRSIDRKVLETLPGLTLKRAQILGLEGAPIVQIVFADEAGVPVAFCMIRLDGTGAKKTAITSETLAGLASTSWKEAGYGYMVVGGQDEAVTAQLADQLVQRF